MSAIRNDTDIQLYIVTDVASNRIEVYVPGVSKYGLSDDLTRMKRIRVQLQKNYGVSMIGNTELDLKNSHHRYSDNHASSIFYGEQMIKDWLRIRSGWGPSFGRNVDTQFQGRIRLVRTTERRHATIIAYDALRDLLDATVSDEGGLTVNDALVPDMNPMDIIHYLVHTKFGLRWMDMDALAESELLDTVSLAAAHEACAHVNIIDTTWTEGSKLLDMLQDMMKIVGGYLYGGKDGKLYVYIYQPGQDLEANYSFEGREATDTDRQVLVSRREKDLDSIINKVVWTYGQSSTKHVSPTDTDSIDKYEEKTLALSTKWETTTSDLDVAAERLILRYSEPIGKFSLDISWLMNGEGLDIELGDLIQVSDPALNISDQYIQVLTMETPLLEQRTTITGEDATAIQGKFGFFSSEVDEGDGWDITANDFENWRKRFCFFGEAPATDPHFDGAANPGFDADGNVNGVIDADFGTPDTWGNGVEENFIFF